MFTRFIGSKPIRKSIKEIHILAKEEFTTEELNGEIWLPVTIVDYKSFYSVSSLGRIRREVTRSGTTAGRILKPTRATGGYVRVSLSAKGKVKNFRIHTLVTQAFIGSSAPGLMPNHKDLNKTNNRLDNFEYVTALQNKHHAMRYGHESRGPRHGELVKAKTARGDSHYARQRPHLLARGESHGQSKLTSDAVVAIRAMISQGVSNLSIATRFKVHPTTVSDIKRKKIWRHIT